MFKRHPSPLGRKSSVGCLLPICDNKKNALIPKFNLDNEFQPDVVLVIDVSAGGHSDLGEDCYIEGAPELVAEIAASIATIDLGDKLRAYRRNGLQKYIVWQVFDQKIDWFSLQNGEGEAHERGYSVPGREFSECLSYPCSARLGPEFAHSIVLLGIRILIAVTPQ